MENIKNSSVAEGRKNFLMLSGLALAGAVIGKISFGMFSRIGRSGSGVKVKMLTADGKLVEVDKAFIKKRKKVSGKEILTWMNKPQA